MNDILNLKLKDGVEPSVLLKYGFAPKYDENTGEIKKYIKKIHIADKEPYEQHFTFIFYAQEAKIGLFRRAFRTKSWMSGFCWSSLMKEDAVQLLYDLIIDGIVEPT